MLDSGGKPTYLGVGEHLVQPLRGSLIYFPPPSARSFLTHRVPSMAIPSSLDTMEPAVFRVALGLGDLQVSTWRKNEDKVKVQTQRLRN